MSITSIPKKLDESSAEVSAFLSSRRGNDKREQFEAIVSELEKAIDRPDSPPRGIKVESAPASAAPASVAPAPASAPALAAPAAPAQESAPAAPVQEPISAAPVQEAAPSAAPSPAQLPPPADVGRAGGVIEDEVGIAPRDVPQPSSNKKMVEKTFSIDRDQYRRLVRISNLEGLRLDANVSVSEIVRHLLDFGLAHVDEKKGEVLWSRDGKGLRIPSRRVAG